MHLQLSILAIEIDQVPFDWDWFDFIILFRGQNDSHRVKQVIQSDLVPFIQINLLCL